MDTSHVVRNFFKVNMLETEPSTQDIEENIFEEDLSILVDKLVDLYFQETNKGKKLRKQFVLDYFNSYKVNLQEIYCWIQNNQTCSNSNYLLGYFNYHGIGIDINMQNAFKYYQKAAELENVLAQFELASNMYFYGKGVNNNYYKVFKLSEKLSNRKYSCGINLLAYCYEHAFGTNMNGQKAFELYQDAADLGNVFGIYNLGRCYRNGIGIKVNIKKALELYQKAANYGYHVAQQNIALMYEKGFGTEKNIDQAIHWYKKSAVQGNKYSQSKLKQLLKE